MSSERIYILGCGAIGFPLAAFLTRQGKNVIAVRTSTPHSNLSTVEVAVTVAGDRSIARYCILPVRLGRPARLQPLLSSRL